MNDQADNPAPADPRCERLVALLYGELAGAEADALRLEIARDPALRRDWEAIRSAREALATLPAVEPVRVGAWSPLDAAPARDSDRGRDWRPVRGRDQPPGAGGRVPSPGRSRDRFRRLLQGPAWGVAAAALLILVLGLARFRVERVDHGFAFTLGVEEHGTGSDHAAVRAASPAVPAGANGPFADVADLAGTVAGQDIATPRSASYVTRAELRDFGTELSRDLALFLDQRAGKRDAELAAWMQVAFQDLSRRQTAGYGDLRGRIEEVGIGLARGQYDANERINLLLREDRGQLTAPAVVPVIEEGEFPK